MTHHTPIKRLLIANRGEIAVRIIKTARRLGIHTIALYSDADARAMHVREADEAWHLGPALPGRATSTPARCSRLPKRRMPTPSTRATVSCPRTATLPPPASSGPALCRPKRRRHPRHGGQVGAKGLMQAAGVPVLPGYHGADQHPDFLRDQASQVGFLPLSRRPVAAVARGCAGSIISWPTLTTPGGGQAGGECRLWRRPCAAGALSPRARHVEVQVFADALATPSIWGQGLLLAAPPPEGDRGGPAPDISSALRRAMGEAAVGGQNHPLSGAGTIEFLLCKEEFFMEMNTRLQVGASGYRSHHRPGSGGLAAGGGRGQTAAPHPGEVVLRPRGEARLYAEDVAAGFLPASGPIHWLTWPAGCIDTGVTAGDEVSPYYDPMIAKLVAHAPSRSEAFATLADAPAALDLGPLVHNGPLLQRACAKRQRCWRCATTPSGPFPPTPCRSGARPALATLWLATCERDAPGSRPQVSAGPTRRFCATVRIGEETRTLTLAERGAPCSGRASRSR